MNWILLILAGLFEVCWAIGLKYTHGFTRLYPTLFTLGTMSISFFLLAMSLRTLPIGTAYAVWTGIGTVGTIIAGIFFFEESASILRIVCLLMILGGIVGLKLLTK